MKNIIYDVYYSNGVKCGVLWFKPDTPQQEINNTINAEIELSRKNPDSTYHLTKDSFKIKG